MTLNNSFFYSGEEYVYECHVYNEKGFLKGTVPKTDTAFYQYLNRDKEQNNNRTWLILSSLKEKHKQIILKGFIDKGKMLGEYKADGAEIYLFDMRAKKKVKNNV